MKITHKQYIIFVMVAYIVMSVYISGFVHEYVHMVQYSNKENSIIEEVCFAGIKTSYEGDVDYTTNEHMNNLIKSMSNIGGWVKIDGDINTDYKLGINSDESQAFFIQLLFLFILLYPANKIWIKLNSMKVVK